MFAGEPVWEGEDINYQRNLSLISRKDKIVKGSID
jgi:hypothetical protein